MNINVAIKIKKGINFKKNSLEVLIREIAPPTEQIIDINNKGSIFLYSIVEKVFLNPNTEPK